MKDDIQMTQTQKASARAIFKVLTKLDELGLKLVDIPAVPVELISDLADATQALEGVAFDLVQASAVQD